MKKIISYIWPFTKYVKSKYNGRLEVTLTNGRKVLDSYDANYSYGSVQVIMDYGLSKAYDKSIKNILILGLGGGCVIKTLRDKYNYTNKITAVDIDSEIIKIAKNEFDICNSENTNIIEQNALTFVKNNKEKYSLIIIDIYIGLKVPEAFYGGKFWRYVLSRLEHKGIVVFNAGINLESNKKIKEIIKQFETELKFDIHTGICGTNTLLIGRRI